MAVSAAVTGLAANTTYHFRISATNAGGTSKGSDETFKTHINPPTAARGPASAVTQTSATLNGTVNPHGEEVTECKLEYGPTEPLGFSAPCSPPPGSGTVPVAVSAAVTGLTVNTTYSFRITATSAGGTGNVLVGVFKTLPKPPIVVTGMASSVTQTSATMDATVNPEGGEVSKCEFEYGTTTSYGSSAPCSAPPGSGSSPVEVSAAVTGLAPNTTYHFRISATNAGGTRTGPDQTLTTLPAPPPIVQPNSGPATPGTAVNPVTTAVAARLPAPELARSANIAAIAGRVLIRLPGSRAFLTLSGAQQIPFGTVVEAVHGEVSVTAATPGGGTQKGQFFDGEFVLSQNSSGRVLATLAGGDFSVCRPRAGAASRRRKAHSKFAASTHLVRRLWAEARGDFSTRARYAGGVVRGAQWLTEDMCEGTLILATRERVEVTDLVRHRHIAVRTGYIYRAKPR